jgi:uncharacterized damage-inducible protein DinB
MLPSSTLVQMILKTWNTELGRTDAFFDTITDDQLSRPVAPGKNSIAYLMGHLIAANDSMIKLYGLGERQYAHYDEPFLKNPDNSGHSFPDAASLRAEWKKAKESLTKLFEKMSPEDWMSKHTAMTDEQFAADPGRNKLSVLLSRTNHLSYHLGQLVLATNKAE